ncbi:hypothetical protein ACFLV7_10230 [Chloroflexota bacterium]
MKISHNPPALNHQKILRERYLTIVRASLAVGKTSFARDMVLNWLANYPGDLYAGLLYAEVLMGENRYRHSMQVSRGLLKVDPEFLNAARLLQRTHDLILSGNEYSKNGGFNHEPSIDISRIRAESADLSTCVYSISGEVGRESDLLPWGNPLRSARQALKQGDLNRTEEMIRQTLSVELTPLLAVVTHLEYLEANGSIPLQSKLEIAHEYHQRWSDCLVCKLSLAHWLMEFGKGDRAVALLHEAAARDVNGQVPARLWNSSNPYHMIWPRHLELALEAPIPSEVVAYLGWNRIAGGTIPSGDLDLDALISELYEDHIEVSSSEPELDDFIPAAAAITASRLDSQYSSDEGEKDSPSEDSSSRLEPKISAVVTNQAREEIERLAVKRNLPGVTKLDGRYPVYVVFSLHSRLVGKYGEKNTAILEDEMKRLVKALQKYPRWGSLMLFADDPVCLEPYGIQPVETVDPWAIKLAIADLDAALAKHGEMIGALLIVGGPDIIPFHNLPNPVDDPDLEVPSDNPYGTRDENYFIPEWPVGRLPGGAGPDISLLYEQLKRIADRHSGQSKYAAGRKNWLSRFMKWIISSFSTQKKSYGYTAEIWKQASLKVFRPIGESKSMFVSPPYGFDGVRVNSSSDHTKNGRDKQKLVRLPKSRLGYYNLHGLVDAAEWYGQSDPIDHADGPDYPIALRPQDISINGRKKTTKSPQIVFSEACYGMHIIGKSVEEAMALKFLQSGSKAVVGSTCMSYGSIAPPLIAADLLGFQFWKFLHDGLPAGEALKQAKISLASEMHHRQGYLDGEDQKTLISFVLYGDPLDKPFNGYKGPKSIQRLIDSDEINIVCDRSLETYAPKPIPDEVLGNVKQILKQYLPGMTDAQLIYCQERGQCGGNGHKCPTSQLEVRAHSRVHSPRSLITINKNVTRENRNHPHYARLTLNGEGKLVKLVVSR